jgi:hypothetical protein
VTQVLFCSFFAWKPGLTRAVLFLLDQDTGRVGLFQQLGVTELSEGDGTEPREGQARAEPLRTPPFSIPRT